MSLISIETYEHLVEENIVVSYKIVKFCGIPLYTIKLESSNYNLVGQFDAQNFTKKEEEKPSPLYTETKIGFENGNNETEI